MELVFARITDSPGEGKEGLRDRLLAEAPDFDIAHNADHAEGR
jgi:hypothetical protein